MDTGEVDICDSDTFIILLQIKDIVKANVHQKVHQRSSRFAFLSEYVYVYTLKLKFILSLHVKYLFYGGAVNLSAEYAHICRLCAHVCCPLVCSSNFLFKQICTFQINTSVAASLMGDRCEYVCRQARGRARGRIRRWSVEQLWAAAGDRLSVDSPVVLTVATYILVVKETLYACEVFVRVSCHLLSFCLSLLCSNVICFWFGFVYLFWLFLCYAVAKA